MIAWRRKTFSIELDSPPRFIPHTPIKPYINARTYILFILVYLCSRKSVGAKPSLKTVLVLRNFAFNCEFLRIRWMKGEIRYCISQLQVSSWVKLCNLSMYGASKQYEKCRSSQLFIIATRRFLCFQKSGRAFLKF